MAAIRIWEQHLATKSGDQTTGYGGAVVRGILIDASGANFAVGIKCNQDDVLIENNEVHNSLEAFNTRNNIFRNNVIYGIDMYGTAFSTKGGARNTQVYNNVFHLICPSWCQGLVLGGTSGAQWDFEPSVGTECYNCVAYNNVVINETGRSYEVFTLAGCQDCTFLNNIGISGTTMMRGGGGALKTSPNPTWKNNILTIPSDPGLTADWHLTPWSGYQGAGIGMPTVPAYGGGMIDVSKNKDGVVRPTPWNLGIY
jgi:hypothetical protein